VDEDRLSPELGRLIDAAKAAAIAAAVAEGAPAAPARREGWALLGGDGRIYAGPEAAAAPQPVAAAFAVAGESADTALPRGDWRTALGALDPDLPVAVKYLGRWVVIAFAEIPSA
jgi:hypothetical protein